MGDLRALFILGFNEGVLPAGITEAGLFSREDKQQLQQRGLYLGHNDEERLCEEEAALYGLIAKPSEQLFLSWNRTGSACCRRMRLSWREIPILREIRKVRKLRVRYIQARILQQKTIRSACICGKSEKCRCCLPRRN